MATAFVKNKNIHIRLSEEAKDRIEKAAMTLGQSLSDFVLSASANRAESVLEQHYVTTLADRDRDRLMALLDEEQEPNDALRDMAIKHKELIIE